MVFFILFIQKWMRVYSVSRTDLSVKGVRFRKIVHIVTVFPMWWESREWVRNQRQCGRYYVRRRYRMLGEWKTNGHLREAAEVTVDLCERRRRGPWAESGVIARHSRWMEAKSCMCGGRQWQNVPDRWSHICKDSIKECQPGREGASDSGREGPSTSWWRMTLSDNGTISISRSPTKILLQCKQGDGTICSRATTKSSSGLIKNLLVMPETWD